jgi:hypothetical protein
LLLPQLFALQTGQLERDVASSTEVLCGHAVGGLGNDWR